MPLSSVALVAATAFLSTTASAGEYEAAPLMPTSDTAEAPRPSQAPTPERPRIGVYGAAGFPSPVSLGALVSIDRRVVLGAEYGFLPFSQVAGVDVTYRSFAGDVRLFPFRNGPLFIGLRAGRQHFDGSKTVTASGRSVTASTSADSWYLNPRIGLFKMWDSGLFLGADLGLRVPIGHSHSEEVPNGQSMPETIANVRDVMTASVIPTITLLQLGVAL